MLTSTKSWYSSSPGEPDGPSGLFLRCLQRHRRSCSNPPSRVRLKMPGKTKNQRNFYAGPFGGRGWMSRAALLKTAHRAVFAPSSAMSPQLFESTRPVSLALQQNKNLSVLSYVEVFWWARVDVASRAAKNSPPGCFCAIFSDVAAAVRIHPRE